MTQDIADQPYVITFLSGIDIQRQPYWVYLAVPVENFESFTQAQDHGGFDLEEYGEVLAYGNGEEPPEDVKQAMKDNYDFDDHFENKLKSFTSLLGDSFR